MQTFRAKSFPVRDYDLGATLASGQAFGWRKFDGGWVGVIGRRWVRLSSDSASIIAETPEPGPDWNWLTEYLQLETDLSEVLKQFPGDEPMRVAIAACRGLRLLRQDPWECLASFICSSTKRIVQIQQIIANLSQRFGDPVTTPSGYPSAHAFPTASALAKASEQELRYCKMGFRAPYLLSAARQVQEGQLELASLGELPVGRARERLMQVPGVGRKIADCILLFAYGFQSAFPVDVWVMKALQELYFKRRRVNLKRLHRFSAEYFGPQGGYAQQYLFHYVRTVARPKGGRVTAEVRRPKKRPETERANRRAF